MRTSSVNSPNRLQSIGRRDFLKILGAAAFSLAPFHVSTLASPRQSDPDIPNILVLVFDALSARHMSLYGYPRRTTPNLEELANNALVYHRHYAAGNFTTPGTASLLTGVYPWKHHAINMHGETRPEFAQRSLFHLLSPRYHTMAFTHNPLAQRLLLQFETGIETLAPFTSFSVASYNYAYKFFQHDYAAAYDMETLVFRNGSSPTSSFFLARFERLFRYLVDLRLIQAYQPRFPLGLPSHWDEVGPPYSWFTLEDAVEWITAQLTQLPAPFTAYIHLFPPHFPYNTRSDFIGRFKDGWQPPDKPVRYFGEGHAPEFLNEERQHYDEYIAYVDAEYAHLHRRLGEKGLLENTVVLFTSDHGEMFERGIYTHNTPTLYEPIIHVPLVVWRPGRSGRLDIRQPTSCVDILPTLLRLGKLEAPLWCEGRVLPGFADQVNKPGDIFVVEAKTNPSRAPLETVTLAMIHWPYKLVAYLGYANPKPVYELFDLENDPDEMNDLSHSRPDITLPLGQALLEKLAQENQP